MTKCAIITSLLCFFFSGLYGTELRSEGKWISESNKNQAEIGKAFDADPATVWDAASPQEEGDYIKIDFGKEIFVYGLVLTAGDKYSFPRGISVSVSSDGKNWTELLSKKTCLPGRRIEISSSNSLSFSFAPSFARMMKISLAESCGFPLKISECKILGVDDASAVSKNRSVIVIPTAASPTISFAAEELKRHLCKMKYFVEIREDGKFDRNQYPDYIFRFGKGKPEHSNMLGNEGYEIRNDGKDVYIGGNTDMALLYGAYALLEQLGMRWFCPEDGEEGEYIPERFSAESIRGINLKDSPSFLLRGFVDAGFLETRNVIWCIRNRINVMGQCPWFALDNINSFDVEKLGGKDYYCSNSGFAWPSGGHSFGYFIPAGKYFEKHPEYFPLINGKRIGGVSQQLCTSNPDVIRIFKERIITYLATKPLIKTVAVCPNDGALKWCECENCRKLDGPEPKYVDHCNKKCRLVSDRYLVFVKEIAEDIKQKYPDVKVLAFGYSVFKAPPKYVRELPDNVILQICQYGEPAQIIGSVEGNKNTLEWMRGWASIKGPELRGYDYLLLREKAHLHTPLFFTEALFHKLKLYRNEFNVKYYQTQFSWTTQNENAMLFYAYVKALWNANLDEEKFYNDFFSKYYGPAAGPMGQYFKMMLKRVKDKKILYGNNYNCPPPADLYDALIVPEVDKLFAEANKLAGKEVIIKQRIKRDYDGYLYAKKCLGLN